MATIIKTRVGAGTPGNVLKRGELAVDPDAGTLHVGNVDDTSVTALVGPLANDGKWVGDGTNIWNANTGSVGIDTESPLDSLHIGPPTEPPTVPDVFIRWETNAGFGQAGMDGDGDFVISNNYAANILF